MEPAVRLIDIGQALGVIVLETMSTLACGCLPSRFISTHEFVKWDGSMK